MKSLGQSAWLVYGVTAVACLATLGEGGGSALSLLIWHALLLVVLLGAWLLPLQGSPTRFPPGASVALLVFVGWVAYGALRAPYAYAAWLVLWELMAFVAVMILAARGGEDLLQRVTPWLFSAALLHAGYAIVQWGLFDQPRPAGTFLNTNHLGGWLVAVSLLWLVQRPPSSSGWLRAVAILPIVAALWVSGSRGALLAGMVGGLGYVLSSWRSWSPSLRRGVAVGGLVVVALFGARFAQRLNDVDPYRFYRFKIWRASMEMIRDAPLLGSGPGQFAMQARRYQFADDHGLLRHDREFRISHSDLLRLPAELGIPGAVLAIPILGLALLPLLRSGAPWGRSRRAACVALLAVAVQATVDNPSNWPALYLLVAVMFGALVARPRPAGPRLSWTFRAGLAVALTMIFVIGDVGPTLAHYDATTLPSGALDRQQQARLHRAVLRNPLQPRYRLRWVDHYLAVEPQLNVDSYLQAREMAELAVRLSPQQAIFSWRLAQLEIRACFELFRDWGTASRAFRSLEQARAAAPTDVRIVLDAAEFAFNLGDHKRARRFVDEALELEPNAVSAHLLSAELSSLQSESDAAARMSLQRAETLAAAEREEATNGYAAAVMRLDPARQIRVLNRLAENQ